MEPRITDYTLIKILLVCGISISSLFNIRKIRNLILITREEFDIRYHKFLVVDQNRNTENGIDTNLQVN